MKNVVSEVAYENCCGCGKCDLCYISIFYGTNYGTMLVSYAVYKLLERTGLSVLTLDRPEMIWSNGARKNHFIPYTFARKHYTNISRIYSNVADLAQLNDDCKAFIVGSDQLFAPSLNLDSIALVPFVRSDRRKIAYATSFGKDSYNAPLERFLRNKELFKRFDHIALREYTPHLMQNVFERDATEVLEPTFCIPEKHYSELADTASDLQLPDEPYLLTYLLDPSAEKEAAICHIARKINLKVIFIRSIANPIIKYPGSKLKGTQDYSPEQFLKLYRGASFVVTDSFHGTCFAIKFNCPFVSLINMERGILRYKLFHNMQLSDRLYRSPEDVFATEAWMKPVDFTAARKYMEEETVRSFNWLLSSLKGIVNPDNVAGDVLPPFFSNEKNGLHVPTFVPDMTDYSLTPFIRGSNALSHSKKTRKGINKAAHDVAHLVRDLIRKLRGKHK